MAYVPAVPGVPPPMSYGQGYGNWQQYAGFDTTKNPYGGSAGLGVDPNAKATTTPPTTPPIDTNVPPVPAPVMPTGQLGANPQNSLGLKPTGQLGQIPQTAQDAINSHYGVR